MDFFVILYKYVVLLYHIHKVMSMRAQAWCSLNWTKWQIMKSNKELEKP